MEVPFFYQAAEEISSLIFSTMLLVQQRRYSPCNWAMPRAVTQASAWCSTGTFPDADTTKNPTNPQA